VNRRSDRRSPKPSRDERNEYGRERCPRRRCVPVALRSLNHGDHVPQHGNGAPRRRIDKASTFAILDRHQPRVPESLHWNQADRTVEGDQFFGFVLGYARIAFSIRLPVLRWKFAARSRAVRRGVEAEQQRPRVRPEDVLAGGTELPTYGRKLRRSRSSGRTSGPLGAHPSVIAQGVLLLVAHLASYRLVIYFAIPPSRRSRDAAQRSWTR